MNPAASDQAELSAWVSRRLGRPANLLPLAGDGGTRRYFRVAGESLAALAGPDPEENRAWLLIGRHLWFRGLPLPRIQEYDLQRGFFLLEDLGDLHLAELADPGPAYVQAVELLARLHRRGPEGFNPAWSRRERTYDAALAAEKEAGYFFREFLLKYLQWPALPPRIWREARAFGRLVAGEAGERTLIYRDYQGRNLMVAGGNIRLIDWQGALFGPAAYDLASLLNETPYHPLTEDFKAELGERYLKARKNAVKRSSFRRSFQLASAARLLQALGAYAKLTLSGKRKFAAFIPEPAGLLARCLKQPVFDNFPLMREAAARAAETRPPSPAGHPKDL